MTYTYAVLEVSAACHAEIRAKLEAAGYQHVFHRHDDREVIDMHGIALAAEPAPTTANDQPRQIVNRLTAAE